MSRTATSMAQVNRSMVTRDPFRELVDFQRGINSLFGEVFGTSSRDSSAVAAWVPPVDIFEDDNGYLIKLELPEIKRDDVKVSLDKNVLSVTGERRVEHEEKRENYHKVERNYGRFYRSFTLPPNANQESVSAEFKEGVLRLAIPKREEAKPKTITVEVK